ncbi:MAG TPA: hypothetical protein VNZ64_02055 [Candidatus Acidoferrum sp.]|jgi:hypothetical protein|nr:hypothetical protein [Candidatus Acidoferrum sp.]
MKQRFILYRRKVGGMFYVEDTETRKQESLGTRDRAEAKSLLNARNESVRQPQLNLQIAKAYLAGTDEGVSIRAPPNNPRQFCKHSVKRSLREGFRKKSCEAA